MVNLYLPLIWAAQTHGCSHTFIFFACRGLSPYGDFLTLLVLAFQSFQVSILVPRISFIMIQSNKFVVRPTTIVTYQYGSSTLQLLILVKDVFFWVYSFYLILLKCLTLLQFLQVHFCYRNPLNYQTFSPLRFVMLCAWFSLLINIC